MLMHHSETVAVWWKTNMPRLIKAELSRQHTRGGIGAVDYRDLPQRIHNLDPPAAYAFERHGAASA
jgi:hypothetical protein